MFIIDKGMSLGMSGELAHNRLDPQSQEVFDHFAIVHYYITKSSD